MATPSREAPQRHTSATNKWGLDREVRGALLRVRTGPEHPESNQKSLRERAA